MSECRHTELVLLRQKTEARLRCRRCHLTIRAAELGGACCPECLDRDGSRNTDFEEVIDSQEPAVRFRCESCGVLIGCREEAPAESGSPSPEKA